AAFDEDDVELAKRCAQAGDRLEIDRGILADGRMRAATRFHAHDALGGERFVAHEELGILLGVDVVGDYRELEVIAQCLAEGQRERRLARADRASDAYPQWLLVDHVDVSGIDVRDQERNSRVYCASCRTAASASPGAKLVHASGSQASPRASSATISP